MLPGQRTLHIDAALSNFSLLLQNQPSAFIADQVLPRFPVSKLTDKYFKFDTKTMYRIDDDLVAPGAVAKEVKWSVTTDTYSCEGHGLRRFVSDRDEANADPAVKPSRSAVRILTHRILAKFEQLVAARMTSTYLTVGTTLSGTSQWSDFTNSDPLANFQTAQETCLVQPNVAIMNEQVYNTLRRHSKLLALYSYTGQGILPDELLAQIMGVQRLIVGRAKYDTTDDASATFTQGYIWGKHCTFAYIDPNAGMEAPTLGWSFFFNDPAGQGLSEISPSGLMMPVRSYRDEATDRGGTWYEIDADYIQKIVTPLVAYHFTNAIA